MLRGLESRGLACELYESPLLVCWYLDPLARDESESESLLVVLYAPLE